MIDSIGKKIKVVQEVIHSIGLTNVEAMQTRVEQLSESFDFIVSRAVTDLSTFDKWTQYKVRKKGFWGPKYLFRKAFLMLLKKEQKYTQNQLQPAKSVVKKVEPWFHLQRHSSKF